MRRGKKIAPEGQSLIELLVGISIAAIVATSVVGAIVLAVRINQQSALSKNASALSQEIIDKARSVTEGNWQGLYGLSDKSSTSTYYITGSSTLSIATGTEDVARDGITYTRWFSVENVNRSATSGDIVDTGGTEDASTQKITTTIQWPFRGDTEKVTIVEYFTRWSKNRVTRFTDWSGNSGEVGPITEETWHYSTSTGLDLSTQGELKLVE